MNFLPIAYVCVVSILILFYYYRGNRIRKDKRSTQKNERQKKIAHQLGDSDKNKAIGHNDRLSARIRAQIQNKAENITECTDRAQRRDWSRKKNTLYA